MSDARPSRDAAGAPREADEDAGELPSGERASELEPGREFGRYRVVRRLGAGGMGVVYEAVHLALKKPVALKVLRRDRAGDARARARFVREAEAAARIRHPHIVDVSDVGVHQGVPFLVMERLEGEDLRARLHREGALAVAQATDLLLPVIAALAAAHEAGVVHRDLKPENVFLARGADAGPSGVRPCVLDFGISRIVDASSEAAGLTSTGALLGTPYYMAPEQARGGGVFIDARSDQYALGVMLYECVTGARPFGGASLFEVLTNIATATPVAPRALRAEIPPGFEQVVMRALSRDPAARFADVRALGAALLPFAGEVARAVWSGTFDAARARDDESAAAPAPGGSSAAAGIPSGAPTPVLVDGELAAGRVASLDAAVVDGAPAALPSRRRGAAFLAGAALVAVAALGGARLGLFATPAPARPLVVSPAATAPRAAAPETFAADVEVTPATAQLELDSAPAGQGALHVRLPRDGAPHALRISAPGFVPQTVAFRDAPPPRAIALEPLPTQAPPPSARRRAPPRPAPPRVVPVNGAEILH